MVIPYVIVIYKNILQFDNYIKSMHVTKFAIPLLEILASSRIFFIFLLLPAYMFVCVHVCAAAHSCMFMDAKD